MYCETLTLSQGKLPLSLKQRQQLAAYSNYRQEISTLPNKFSEKWPTGFAPLYRLLDKLFGYFFHEVEELDNQPEEDSENQSLFE